MKDNLKIVLEYGSKRVASPSCWRVPRARFYKLRTVFESDSSVPGLSDSFCSSLLTVGSGVQTRGRIKYVRNTKGCGVVALQCNIE